MLARQSFGRLASAGQLQFLGMGPARAFSSIRSAVLSNAVFMPEMYPSKLAVPYAGGQNYEFTMHREETISEFQKKVLKDCPDEIKSFELVPIEAKDKESSDTMTIGELKQKNFKMKVNKKTFTVYPDLRSIMNDPWKNTSRKGFEKLRSIDSTLSIGRQMVLAEYYEELHKSLSAKATGGKLTKFQLQSAITDSLSNYQASLSSPEKFKLADEALGAIKSELEKLQKQRDDIMARARARSLRMLRLGFLGVFGQWVGFTVGIYGIYDWNEMEPWTWIVQAFYMMVGSYYYLATKSDWDYSSIYDFFYQRYETSICAAEGLDLEMVKELEQYVQRIEWQIGILKATKEDTQ